ncbi:membrane protein [Purpureocillium lavendulum]|uniref:Membrane protein n=1 Tax=Purpureocillium lavendulum TaxID=1247861 RepID=A0AB34FNG8_9HYPO|nr:membrane protein [Purpureocillium lavendulum]
MDLSEDQTHPSELESPRVPDLSDPDPRPERRRRRRRRLATVYDAVAGQVSFRQAAHDDGQAHANQQQAGTAPTPRPTASPASAANSTKHPTRHIPIGPDEVLFRRRDAPQRYAEHDVYAAHERDLPRGGRGVLPESDLLKAVHTYASRFYGAAERNRANRQREHAPQLGMPRRGVDERSMDETALLAFGILLEEAGREVLGQRGDLVFTEGDGAADEASGIDMPNSSSGDEAMDRDDALIGRGFGGSASGRAESIAAPSPATIIGYQDVGSWKRSSRGPKRRKLSKQQQSGEDSDHGNDVDSDGGEGDQRPAAPRTRARAGLGGFSAARP